MCSHNKNIRRGIFISGILFVTFIIVIPIIAYGIMAINSNSLYNETVCHYKGYYISNDTSKFNKLYSGYLNYSYMTCGPDSNKTYERTILIYSSNNERKINNYFVKHFNNLTKWNCWYEKLNPINGWIGFYPPYDINGVGMLVAGISILVVFIIMILIYLLIKCKNKRNEYKSINDYD